MSQTARLLYYQLNFECNIIGEVIGARRVARGYGFTDADMSELINGGWLVESSGHVYVRHYFEHNRLKNDAQRLAASNQLDNAPEALEFEGEEFKSAFRLMGKAMATDSRQLV